MKRMYRKLLVLCSGILLLIPDLVLAAGGKAEMLIVVADTRKVSWWGSVWFLDMYNTDPFLFGVWCSILTAIMGVTLGLVTDFIMRHTGLDLTSRKLVEH